MKKATLIVLPIILCGCQREFDSNVLNHHELDNVDYSKIDKVTSLINSMDTVVSRSGSRVVGSIEVLTASNFLKEHVVSRSSVSDTLLYLVNYEGEKGFALIGADRRLPLVYALADEGHLHFSDTIPNIGLRIFFDGVKGNIAERLNVSYSKSGDVNKEIPDGMYYKVEKSESIDPMLWQEVAKWGQGSPYNKYCFTKNGEQAVVGCVAVACAQVMTHYNYPTFIGNERLSWRSMKKGAANNDVALLMAKLGDTDLLKMNYGISESTTSVNYIRSAFMNLGYKDNTGATSLIALEDVIEWLGGKKKPNYISTPVILSGHRKDANGNFNGHAWVVDGYIRNKIYLSDDNVNFYYWNDDND